MYEWCVAVVTAIVMDRCSCRQEVCRRHSLRRLAEPLSTNEKKGAIHETSYGKQVLGLHALMAHFFAIVLPLRLIFSHLSCMMSRRRYTDVLLSTLRLRCR